MTVLSAVDGPWGQLGGLVEAASCPFSSARQDSESSALGSGSWCFLQMYLALGGPSERVIAKPLNLASLLGFVSPQTATQI